MPHGEGMKAKNEKRRTRACIYAREAQTRSPAETARPLLLAEPTIARQAARFCRLTTLSRDLAERFTPMSPTRSRLSCAHAHAAPKKGLQSSSRARREEQQRQKAKDATRTQRHAPAFRCRRRIVPQRSLRTTGKEGKREESGRTKKIPHNMKL